MCEYEVSNVQQQKKIIIFYSKNYPLPDTGPTSPPPAAAAASISKKNFFFENVWSSLNIEGPKVVVV